MQIWHKLNLMLEILLAEWESAILLQIAWGKEFHRFLDTCGASTPRHIREPKGQYHPRNLLSISSSNCWGQLTVFNSFQYSLLIGIFCNLATSKLQKSREVKRVKIQNEVRVNKLEADSEQTVIQFQFTTSKTEKTLLSDLPQACYLLCEAKV